MNKLLVDFIFIGLYNEINQNLIRFLPKNIESILAKIDAT